MQIWLGPRTILSNVWVEDELEIPPGFLYHTVAVLVAGQRRHVTIAFHVTDDMKFSASVSQVAVYRLSTQHHNTCYLHYTLSGQFVYTNC